MPTYTYRCKKCEEHFDVFHAISATPRPACPACGARAAQRLLGAGAGVIFKGSGFYETDYKRDASKTNGDGKTEGKETANKPEGKESSPKSESSSSSAPKSKDASGKSKGSDSAA